MNPFLLMIAALLDLSSHACIPSLSIAIKDYSSTAKTYTCKQASDNSTSETDIGGKFDSCMTSISALTTSTAKTLNAYSMYRDTTATKKFTYAGTCTINVTAAYLPIDLNVKFFKRSRVAIILAANFTQTLELSAPKIPGIACSQIVAWFCGFVDFKYKFQTCEVPCT